ncbi:rhodanese-like domain-containing protein [Streptomyces sp. NPDC003035]|uniref:rhodanese-like domain-containing protein n=1 Tax=Streptomyces sp. NPDC003035 TaxID=3364676 RepID=UPI0036BFD6ED
MSQDPWAEMSDEKHRVLGFRAAEPEEALAHFTGRLRFETDPYDVNADLTAGLTGFVVLDVRRRPAYDAEHIEGAVHFSHHDMTPRTLAALDPAPVYITYGWGPGCNGGTRGAAKLAAAGLRAKEMIGGLEYWQKGGYPTAGSGTGSDAESGAGSGLGVGARVGVGAAATTRTGAATAPAATTGCCI